MVESDERRDERRAASAREGMPWGSYDLADGDRLAVRIGPLEVWMDRRGGEVWLAGRSGSGAQGPTWSRWATGAPRERVQLLLRPAFPDRPLIIEPENPFWLLPGTEARVFVRVSLSAQVVLSVEAGRDVLLAEFASAPLSDTWWGGFESGELAYWHPTTARREMREDLFQPNLAACPVVLANHSPSDLKVERLSLRVPHLSLYAHDRHLWGEECSVSYEGEGTDGRIEMAGQAPEEAREGRRIAGPRYPAAQGLRARTFQRLLGGAS